MVIGDKINVFWFRRDLRLHDNHALYRALSAGLPVLCIFIFDKNILDRLENRSDRRVSFIYQRILSLKKEIEKTGSSLFTGIGKPNEIFKNLTDQWNINAVYANEDYEPEAINRDDEIGQLLSRKDIGCHFLKDQVIFSKHEIIKPNDEPYTIFTPYKNRWLSALVVAPASITPFPSESLTEHFLKLPPFADLLLEKAGFVEVEPEVKPLSDDPDTLKKYEDNRNQLYLEGTSHASVHLRFGTVSIRQLVQKALKHSQGFLSELIWRDFFQSILFHFPKVGRGYSFKPAYDNIEWRNDETEFKKWQEGKTGFPVVDAGMRQLKETGFMHNRARMITASFLCKHLLIDWRWGEAWFAEYLLDYDLAANNGNWQWASGSGCDATPYFRIFNPTIQQQKFDPDLIYVKKWVPEFGTARYPQPMVDHDFARKRCIEVYKKALNS